MARPSVGITNQIGVESTYGTGVSAAKRLSSTSIMFSPENMTQFYRAAGKIYPTTGVRHREWSTGSFNGILSYNEIIYVLAGLFGHGTVTQPEVGSYSWPFTPSALAADTIKTFTVQRGDATAAQEVNGGSFTSLTIDFSNDGINISGDFLGRNLDNAASLDTVTATIAESPVSMSDVDVFIDTTSAGLGTTKWTDVMSCSLTIPSKITPKFVLNTTSKSIHELVQTQLEEARIVVRAEYNAQSRAIHDAMMTDSLPFRFIRIIAIGDIVTLATPQKFQVNAAVKLESVTELEDIGGIYGYEYTFRLVYNETFTRALDFTVVNAISAL